MTIMNINKITIINEFTNTDPVPDLGFEFYFKNIKQNTLANIDLNDHNFLWFYRRPESFWKHLDNITDQQLQLIKKYAEHLRVIIENEGYDVFDHPDVILHNNNFNKNFYWRVVAWFAKLGIAEQQIIFVNCANGYLKQIKDIESTKLKWDNKFHTIKARFLENSVHMLDYPKNKTIDDSITFKYVYASLANGRPAQHRYDFTKKLFANNLEQHGKVSLVKMDGGDNDFNKKLPITYDNAQNGYLKDTENHLCSDAFVWISNESYIDPRLPMFS